MAEKSKAEDPRFERWLDPKMWGWQPFIEANQFALENWMKSSAALVNSAVAFSREAADFAQARLQEDVEVWGKFSKCRDAQEAAESQREFVSTATSQYLEQASKLTRLMATLASESFSLAPRAVAEASEAPARKSR